MTHHALPKLVIFDKDGTLIDFTAMWGSWAFGFVERMADAVAPAVREPLYQLFGVDPLSRRIDPHGALAIAPEAATQQQIVRLLRGYGYGDAAAWALVATTWQAPDPAQSAVPCADVRGLCTWLASHGVAIAVATADNRGPTMQTIAALGIAPWVQVIASADDPGVAPKPAPDKIYRICQTLQIAPADAVMVGDTPADMQMGGNAGVGLRVAVTTGVSTSAELQPHADVVIAHVGLLPSLYAAGAGMVY